MKESLCENCGEPLFLSKEECRDFMVAKMKQGYLICKCCGAKHSIKTEDNTCTSPKRKKDS